MLAELKTKRAALAAELNSLRRDGLALGMSAPWLSRITLREWQRDIDALPRPDAAALRNRIGRLIRYANSPIPNHLPCGQDDYAAECRENARREAYQLRGLLSEIQRG